MKAEKSLQKKATQALQEAVKEVVERHKQTGRPLAIWKNNKVIELENKPVDFIITKYAQNRYLVAVVYRDGSIIPEFPFNTEKEAKQWVEKQMN